MSEHVDRMNAFKRELEECVMRRFSGDKSKDGLTVAITATAYVLGQLIASERDPDKREIFMRLVREVLNTKASS